MWSAGVVLLAVAACASGPKVVEESDPWQVDKKGFLRYARLIAVADVYLPGGMPEPDAIKQQFSDLIAERLREKGFTIIYPQQYETAWAQAVDDLGGIEDTSGVTQHAGKIALATTQVLKGLEDGFDVDAVLVPSIVVVEAPFGRGSAAWDGTNQSIKSGGAMNNFFAGSPEGTLGALSLSVTLLSPDGDTYYQRLGGIEVLSKLSGKEFVLVPRSELFTDHERIEQSVKIALDPLLD